MKDLVLGAPAGGSGHDSEADIAAVAFLTSVLIAISLIIEFVTHQLEHLLAKKHVLPVLHHVYKEALILAILSIFLTLEASYHFVEHVVGRPFDSHLFHVLHMSLFYSVMFYIAIVCTIMIHSIRFANTLKKHEACPMSKSVKVRNALAKELAGKGAVGAFFAFGLKSKLAVAEFEVLYQGSRALFISKNNLPADYVFFVYLRKCTREVSLGMTGVHWTVWIIVLLACACSSFVFSASQFGGGTIEYFVLVYFVFAIAIMTKNKASAVRDTLLKADFSAVLHKAKESRRRVANEDDEDDEENALLGDDEDEDAMSEAKLWHRSLFWMHRPILVPRIVQFITLLVAILLPVHINYFVDHWKDFPVPAQVALHFFTIVPLLSVLFSQVPGIIPNFVFASSIGPLVKEHNMREALSKTPSTRDTIPPPTHRGHDHA